MGIAIGAETNVAIESTDLVLVKSNPLDATYALKLAKATYNKMIQNLFWATDCIVHVDFDRGGVD